MVFSSSFASSVHSTGTLSSLIARLDKKSALLLQPASYITLYLMSWCLSLILSVLTEPHLLVLLNMLTSGL